MSIELHNKYLPLTQAKEIIIVLFWKTKVFVTKKKKNDNLALNSIFYSLVPKVYNFINLCCSHVLANVSKIS